MKMELVESVGDIDVWSSDHLAQITVDDEVVLTIPRADHGLAEVVQALKKLIK